MGLQVISDEKAGQRIYPLCLCVPDPRARWMAKNRPEETKLVIKVALGLLPEDIPHFPSDKDRQVFVEAIQFETILTLRQQEAVIGMALNPSSCTRWQWIAERAIGELVSVVVDQYLDPQPAQVVRARPKRNGSKQRR